jgi:hypothetical protein
MIYSQSWALMVEGYENKSCSFKLPSGCQIGIYHGVDLWFCGLTSIEFLMPIDMYCTRPTLAIKFLKDSVEYVLDLRFSSLNPLTFYSGTLRHYEDGELLFETNVDLTRITFTRD